MQRALLAAAFRERYPKQPAIQRRHEPINRQLPNLSAEAHSHALKLGSDRQPRKNVQSCLAVMQLTFLICILRFEIPIGSSLRLCPSDFVSIPFRLFRLFRGPPLFAFSAFSAARIILRTPRGGQARPAIAKSLASPGDNLNIYGNQQASSCVI